MSLVWQQVKTYTDIFYEKADGIAKVTINRPEKRNAFRPETIMQMYEAFIDAMLSAPVTSGGATFEAGGPKELVRTVGINLSHSGGDSSWSLCNRSFTQPPLATRRSSPTQVENSFAPAGSEKATALYECVPSPCSAMSLPDANSPPSTLMLARQGR